MPTHRDILVLALLAVILYSVQCYKVKDVELPSSMDDMRIFASGELAEYDGSDPEKPIYMAIKGVVFDVSTGADFYGKGASYNALVGMDSTRAVAKMSLDPSDLNSNIDDLGDRTLESLDKVFEGTYLSKYPIAGYMDYLVIERHSVVRDGTEL